MSPFFEHMRHQIHGFRGGVHEIGSASDDFQVGTQFADTLFGAAGDDIQLGGGGSDFLSGGRGNDFQSGGSGADVLFGGRGDDVQFGDSGNDILFGGRGDDVQLGGSGNDFLDGGRGDDFQAGGLGADMMFGGRGDDVQFGDEGNDRIDGGRGNDFLNGGIGADVLTGGRGRGRDTFSYDSVADSLGASGQFDTITDFQRGLDKIDLSAIDANVGRSGHQSFQYVAYDPTKPLQAGQVTSHYDAALGVTIVEGNIDSLGDAELRIDLAGNVSLDQNDFIV